MRLRDIVRLYLRPKGCFRTIFEIDVAELRRCGIKGVCFDLDNTLVLWNHRTVTPELQAWFDTLHSVGLATCIISNNVADLKSAQLAEKLGAKLIAGAGKPRARGFLAAMEAMGTAPGETAVVGDQLFTDVLGGNLLGMYTVLVEPLGRKEFVGTKFFRLLERIALWLCADLKHSTSKG
ncbi:MAG: YqeG family HAD IIIA-type phosphatase [Bacillota bacterium]